METAQPAQTPATPPPGTPPAPATPATPPPPPPVQTPPAASPAPKPAGKGSPIKGALLTFVFFVVGIGLGYLLSTQFPKPQTETKSETAEKKTAEFTLPTDAEDTKVCIKGKGHLYARKADLAHGPYYIVDDAEKVIGLEYTVTEEEFDLSKEVTATTPEFTTKVDHIVTGEYPDKRTFTALLFVTKEVANAVNCPEPTPTAEPSPGLSGTPAATSGTPTPTKSASAITPTTAAE